MSLSVSCPNCGKAYRVKEELSGKRFRCHQCQAVVSIPVAQPLAAAQDITIGQSFPELAQNSFPPVPVAAGPATADWAMPLAPLQPIPVSVGSTLPAGNVGSPMPAIKVHSKQKKPSQQQLSAAFVLMLFGIGGLLTTIFVAVSLFSFTGALLVLVGLLLPAMVVLGLWSQIGILWVAFREDFVCGVMCLLVPFYYFYFIISRWRYTARYACMLGVQTVMTVVVIAVIAINAPQETAEERSRRMEAQNIAILNDSLAEAGLFANEGGTAAPQYSGPTTNGRPMTPDEVAQWKKEWEERDKEREKWLKEMDEKALQARKELDLEVERMQEEANQPPTIEKFERGQTYTLAQAEKISTPATGETKLESKQKILVSWGSSWYECEVVDVADPQHPRIHYVGWGQGSDENVSLDRVRLPNATESEPSP